jgi:hypothetical protein
METTTEEFKPGDNISLNTGYLCDTGKFIQYTEKDGKKCAVWESCLGGIYTTPVEEYRITKKSLN